MEFKSISLIQGFEEYTNYEMNIAGELRNKKTGRIKKWTISDRGYKQATLSPGYKPIQKHRALACLFIPNPDGKPCVDHINRIRIDNRIENLKWATYAKNNQNRSLSSANTSGEQNIRPMFNHKKPVWKINIKITENGKIKQYTKTFPRDPNSTEIPAEVILKRNEMKILYHGITIGSPMNNIQEIPD